MKVCIPLADGFEDIEALAVVDILRRAGISIDTVGVPGSVITSKSGVRLMVDKRVSQIKADDYDGIILSGGGKNVDTLSRTSSVMEAVKRLDARGKLVAAICAAPTILVKAGVLDGRRATIFPGMERELPKPRADKIVVDGKIVTSQGAGTAVEFALKIVELLTNRNKAEKVRQEIVA